MSNNRNLKRSSDTVRNNYKKYNSYYTTTSEAFKVFPDYEQDYKPPLKKKTKTKIKERYVKAEQKEHYLSSRFFVTLFVVATIALCAVNISARTIERRFDIEELNRKLKEIKEANKNLETEIAKNLDLEYVENYATKNLKMQKPSSHQIIHISVPKESYAIKNDNLILEEKLLSNNFNFFNLFKSLKK